MSVALCYASSLARHVTDKGASNGSRVQARTQDECLAHGVLHRAQAFVPCGRNRDCHQVTTESTRMCVCVSRYHGSMTLSERNAAHQAFLRDDKEVMVATLAYGMAEHTHMHTHTHTHTHTQRPTTA